MENDMQCSHQFIRSEFRVRAGDNLALGCNTERQTKSLTILKSESQRIRARS